MSNNTQTKAQRQSLAKPADYAAPKRVRQAGMRHQFGSWWDLRYPVRAK